MINLLPPEEKRQIRAARTNVVLYRYCMLVLATAAVLGAVFGAAFWANAHERTLAQKSRSDARAALQEYAQTRQAAAAFAADLTAARSILDGSVSFSLLVLDIARIVPQGVILNNLSLGGETSANSPLDINGRAVSYDSAVALKSSLEASSLFRDVTIANITQADTSAGGETAALTQRYPFSVSIQAQFTDEALKGESK